jgi:hypothetical protein
MFDKRCTSCVEVPKEDVRSVRILLSENDEHFVLQAEGSMHNKGSQMLISNLVGRILVQIQA